MIPALALLLSCLGPQDEISSWIVQLGDDSIEIREEATRRLQRLKVTDVARLETAMKSASNAEVRARLASVISHIRKSSELAKVFGPTRRITISGPKLNLSDLLGDLARQVGPTLEMGNVDPTLTIDLALDNVTWWEALDRAAAAADLKYELETTKRGTWKLRWVAGRAPPLPVVYLEQFRISIRVSRKLEFREPGRRSEAGMVAVEVLHQPDLKPVNRSVGDRVQIAAVRDAKGVDARIGQPEWVNSRSLDSPFREGAYASAWVSPDSTSPLTVSGTTDILFAKGTQETTLDVKKGAEKRLDAGETTLNVTTFKQLAEKVELTLMATSDRTSYLLERLDPGSVVIVDEGGVGHPGKAGTVCDFREYKTWDYVFEGPIKGPKTLRFLWVTEFHKVELPYRLEGVRLP